MSTYAPQLVKEAALEVEAMYPSAVFSGIVAFTGGYHASIEDSVPGSYSVVRPDDAAPPGDWPRNLAAAFDMSMNSNDMIVASQRIVAVWENQHDTRRNYINACNGWLGGGNAIRWDFVTGGWSVASWDHTWHTHSEWRRKYVNDPVAKRAFTSMYAGESHDAFLAWVGVPPAGGGTTPPPDGSLPYYPNGTRTLYRDNPMLTGTDVKYVQQFIGSNKCGPADGIFGDKTVSGVRWYQGMRGITVDGIVGPVTWSHLLS